MKNSRRVFLTMAASAVAAPAYIRNAKAAEHSFRFGNEIPLTNPVNVALARAAEAIKRESNGKVELQLFPSGQLGGAPDLLAQVRSGALDFYSPSGAVLSTMVPVGAINSVGFAFPNIAKVWEAMDGDLGAHIRAKFEGSPLHLLEKGWDNGFRQITTSGKAINVPADLNGVKLRVPPSPLYTSMFSALGAAPTAIPFAEAYTSLQTRIVDGQENPLPLILDSKFYEVQKYVSITNHMWDGYWVVTNRRKWQALPGDVSSLLAKHINEAALFERAEVAKQNDTAAAGLKEKGMILNEVNTEPFRDILKQKGFYNTWRTNYGAESWAVLEKYTGALT